MKKNTILDELILERYIEEDVLTLSIELGISETNLRVRASRLGIKKGSISNRIVDGNYKKCSRCKCVKALECFRRDKYQPSGYDYNCIECREESKKIKEMDIEERRALYNDYDPARVDMSFNKGNKQNKIIERNGVQYLKCKSCNQYLTLDYFHKDKKASHGHKNYCKHCIKRKKEGLL